MTNLKGGNMIVMLRTGEKKVKNQSIPIPIRKLTCGMFGIDLLIVKQNPKPYQATLHDCCHVNRGVVTLEFF
jgi:hypothetical protein